MKLILAIAFVAAMMSSGAEACEHGSLKQLVEKARTTGLVVLELHGNSIGAAIDYVEAMSASRILGDFAVLAIGRYEALVVISYNGCIVGGEIYMEGRPA